MRVRQLAFRVSSSVAVAFLYLSLTAPTTCAQSDDPPLTKQIIISHWQRNPRRLAQDYIENTVKKRKVGFLPTKGVRRELSRYGVPAEVLDALRLNFRDDVEFKFQVWSFEASRGTLTAEELTTLARAIIDELRDKESELGDVFRHFKPPLPEPCVQTEGGPLCPETTGALLQVKGSVRKVGGKLNAVVRLSYVSPAESQPIGGERVIVIRAKNDEGLKMAAAEIVRNIHENIRQEVKEL